MHFCFPLLNELQFRLLFTGRGPDEMFHEFMQENIPQGLPKNPFAHIRLKNVEIAL